MFDIFRAHLREKHAKHLLDLREYYEQEIHDLRLALSRSDDITSRSPFKRVANENQALITENHSLKHTNEELESQLNKVVRYVIICIHTYNKDVRYEFTPTIKSSGMYWYLQQSNQVWIHTTIYLGMYSCLKQSPQVCIHTYNKILNTYNKVLRYLDTYLFLQKLNENSKFLVHVIFSNIS